MVFILILFLSLIGIGVMLLILSRRYESHTHVGDQYWFNPEIDIWISESSAWIENTLRDTVRAIIKILLRTYHHMNARFKMKSYIKRKLREYLYEHSRESKGRISSLLRHVQKEKGVRLDSEK